MKKVKIFRDLMYDDVEEKVNLFLENNPNITIISLIQYEDSNCNRITTTLLYDDNIEPINKIDTQHNLDVCGNPI